MWLAVTAVCQTFTPFRGYLSNLLQCLFLRSPKQCHGMSERTGLLTHGLGRARLPKLLLNCVFILTALPCVGSSVQVTLQDSSFRALGNRAGGAFSRGCE